MRVCAILCVRNEAAFLLEWLAHHRTLGITDILAFSNDCEDGTDAMLDRLAQMGLLTHIRTTDPGPRGPQWAALDRARNHPLFLQSDWAISIDIDEFINVHVGDHSLAALMAALPDAQAITLTWRMFGNAGLVDLRDAPVTETFTRAAADPLHWPWRALMFKTLFRRDAPFGAPGVHRPKGGAEASWFDSQGRPLPGGPQQIFSALGAPNYRLAQINHYALGTMAGYLLKADRGRANRDASAFDLGYWVERNLCHVEDQTILALDSTTLRSDLLADPVLGHMHRAAHRWRQDRFAALMRQEPYRDLFARMMLTPPSRALTADQARLIWHHALLAQKSASSG